MPDGISIARYFEEVTSLDAGRIAAALGNLFADLGIDAEVRAEVTVRGRRTNVFVEASNDGAEILYIDENLLSSGMPQDLYPTRLVAKFSGRDIGFDRDDTRTAAEIVAAAEEAEQAATERTERFEADRQARHADQVAKHGAEIAEAEARSAEAGLPSLSGTPNQVSWAVQLRDRLLTKEPSSPLLKKATTARYWIDNRKHLGL